MIKRRTFLTGAAAASLPLLMTNSADFACAASPANDRSMTNSSYKLSATESRFITDLQTRCYRFFAESADRETGLIADRAATDGSSRSAYASSAACGFGLTAHSIAAKAKWGDPDQARQRAERLLSSLLNLAEHQNGFTYHYFNSRTGERAMNCEASSIDTALMVAGAMVAAETFGRSSQVGQLADQLCDRVDWQWMLNGSDMFSMGWKPESGFLPFRWDRFSELTLMVLIAIGARSNAAGPECWGAWRREDILHINGQPFLGYPPLFVHQYPQAYFDFRSVASPSGRSYWENSVRAHLAQIEYMTQLSRVHAAHFAHYGPLLWGLTSSDSVAGYRDWGGPYRDDSYEPERGIDGTLVPSAAGGGLAIVPEPALQTLQHQRATYGESVYGRYGFVNAYNPSSGWVGGDVIGIDTGITLLMAENLRSESIWQNFMQHDIAQRGLERAGFTPMA